MSMSDPISDLLTRIRNGLHANREKVDVPASRLKREICTVLQNEGYIAGFTEIDDGKQGMIRITLRYLEDGKPVIQGIERVSKPSLRRYVGSRNVPMVRSGLGVSVLTTPNGVMTGKQAREARVGGEVLCRVW
jgi:small subunit ribosomal protein S8